MSRPGQPAGEERRVGDRIAIPGGYQHRAYHQGPAPQRFWTRTRIEEAVTLLRIGPGARVLDAGCGSGLLAARAAEAGAARVVGVDANPAAIEFARATFPHPALDFRSGLVDELELAPGSFDRIAFLEVIEHLSRAQGEAILALFHRLLAPGGRLVLSTPNRASPWPLLESLLDHLRLVPQLGGEQHEVLYTLDELRALGEAAGFRLAEWRMVNTLAPWAAWFGPRIAAAVHRWEVRRIRRHGSVMVLAFDREATRGADTDASTP
jgi:2-polyprenyl-3-methyl-5-hydroxy-6-metoxy-1,4-benzoquinol methylase